MAQPGAVAFPVGDQVAALLDKEIRPFLEPVVVDAVGIGGVQLVDAEPQRGLVHCAGPSVIARRGSDEAISMNVHRSGARLLRGVYPRAGQWPDPWARNDTDVDGQAPVRARYFFQKPRIAASLARKFCDCASCPPIITTPLSSSL